jgi:hypothetical protein
LHSAGFARKQQDGNFCIYCKGQQELQLYLLPGGYGGVVESSFSGATSHFSHSSPNLPFEFFILLPFNFFIFISFTDPSASLELGLIGTLSVPGRNHVLDRDSIVDLDGSKRHNSLVCASLTTCCSCGSLESAPGSVPSMYCAPGVFYIKYYLLPICLSCRT